jgi:hypothetical protein
MAPRQWHTETSTRKIFDVPIIYEFAHPIGGIYPPWDDPSYWNEGVAPHFDWGAQRRALAASTETYFDLFFRSQGSLVVGFLILFLMRHKWRSSIKDIAEHWSLLVPAVAALGIYAPVYIEPRYVGAYVVLIWMGVACGVRLPNSPESSRLVACMTIAMLTTLMIVIGSLTAPKAYSTARDLLRGLDASVHVQWQVADGLSQLGVQAGDKVAILGQGTPKLDAHWARLARVRIVAEIPSPDVHYFWAADPMVKSQVIETFARTGAKVIVAEAVPRRISTAGWQRIGNTDYLAYLLSARP